MSKKIVIPIVVALAIALIAGLWVSTEAYAKGNGPLSRLRKAGALGQVTAIGEDQFTIQTAKGQELTFVVDENTRYRSKETAELTFDDLQVGQWVAVAAPKGDQQSKTARFVITLPADFDPAKLLGSIGKVIGVDAAADQFSMQPAQGDALTVHTDEDTRFLGGVETLEDLVEGMPVFARGEKQADDSLLAGVVGARQEGARQALNRYAGEYIDIDETAGTFTLRTRAGEELTFSVDENTRYKTLKGELKGLADLEVGMVGIVVARPGETDGSLTAALVTAAAKDSLPQFDKKFAGKVVSVDTDTFTIEARDGQQYTFKVTGETHFRSRGGQVQSLEDLKEGMIVVVGAKELGNGEYHAQLVIAGARRR